MLDTDYPRDCGHDIRLQPSATPWPVRLGLTFRLRLILSDIWSRITLPYPDDLVAYELS